MKRTRSLSAIQPTGHAHLGNFLGAITRWVSEQDAYDTFFFVVDLHAMTSTENSATLARDTVGIAQLLLAAGIDPDHTTIFVQSQVGGHTELGWLLACTARFGELSRMTQFKDRVARGQEGSVTLGLFSYPVLMAADILLYDAERVPVGEDQRQHVELCREIGRRFNRTYGETFVVPEAIISSVAAKICDLEHPTQKMSKSLGTEAGTIFVLDSPEVIARKVRRATTDSDAVVDFDPVERPGVSNLLTILSACSDLGAPEVCAESVSTYSELKTVTAEAIVEFLRPVRERYEELDKNPDVVADVIRRGRERAQLIAADTLNRAKVARGLSMP